MFPPNIQLIPGAALEVGLVQQLVPLVNRAYARHWELFPVERTTVEGFVEETAESDCLLLSNEATGRLVGFARLMDEGDELYLGMVAIAPECHGQGLGTRLLQAVEMVARQRGKRSVWLTSIYEIGNVAYYERRGYHVEKREVQPVGTWGSTQPFTLATLRKVM
ncbi:MAG: GNAT family N-acetyltransferase [Chloroflexaceae bacterium]|nr:GNAT family N-acetyltransferase [Chloroflexaceae bacterium]